MHTYLRNCDVLQFCQTLPPSAEPSASRKTVFSLGGTGVNFVVNATLIILKVEIPVVNFTSNLTGILTAEIRVLYVSTNTTLILAREILEETQLGLLGSE